MDISYVYNVDHEEDACRISYSEQLNEQLAECLEQNPRMSRLAEERFLFHQARKMTQRVCTLRHIFSWLLLNDFCPATEAQDDWDNPAGSGPVAPLLSVCHYSRPRNPSPAVFLHPDFVSI